MKILRHHDPEFDQDTRDFFFRRSRPTQSVQETVEEILQRVESDGDAALIQFARQFDKVELTPDTLAVTAEELASASRQIKAEFAEAIAASKRNITLFANHSLRSDWMAHNEQGAEVGERFQPMRRVGIYVPGGSAPLVSTALMTVGFAAVAGVPEIVVCTPCGPDRNVNPSLLHALNVAGATEIFKIGGAHAIAAMAFGTETISPVDKIFGPGNRFVVEAKRQVFGLVSIDLLPGPSEILVLADDTGDARFIAADLLAQAEHGGDSVIAFLTTSEALLEQVKVEIIQQASKLARGAQIQSVLNEHCVVAHIESIDQGILLANEFAPEHLSLVVADEEEVLPQLRTAGAIFVGNQSPVAVGDFLAGPSHTLPTGGGGKSFPGLMADQFQLRTSIVRLDSNAMRTSAPIIETFGRMEGLDAHARSATIRTEAE